MMNSKQIPTSTGSIEPAETVIQQCVRSEMRRYFEMLDGEPPCDLYHTLVSQIEKTLIDVVLDACDGNQTRAAAWLGISRGTLRKKYEEHMRQPEDAPTAGSTVAAGKSKRTSRHRGRTSRRHHN